jgi:hypothetical protein
MKRVLPAAPSKIAGTALISSACPSKRPGLGCPVSHEGGADAVAKAQDKPVQCVIFAHPTARRSCFRPCCSVAADRCAASCQLPIPQQAGVRRSSHRRAAECSSLPHRPRPSPRTGTQPVRSCSNVHRLVPNIAQAGDIAATGRPSQKYWRCQPLMLGLEDFTEDSSNVLSRLLLRWRHRRRR